MAAHKILVIGSGPIIIGQAAEFDYAGSQACRALREEGHSVVLINSNPATIMTDPATADAVYIEPLTPEFCRRVIERERPDGLLPTLGGQTGLNLASEIAAQGMLEEYGIKLLGTPLEAIRQAEDRELFRALMREIKEPVPESWIIESEEELRKVSEVAPYPAIVRPAYTLGGTGGGIADTPEDLIEIGRKGLRLSMRNQIMVERSLLGWKEVEYEVMRDAKGTVITVCNMENLDPMGVHTGDSIVVAPSQTLSDIEYHMLRTASLKIISALGIEGGCNVQLAVNPESFDYYIIEVNPRVSRSSALASKATGYPIARVAAKIAIGKGLDEIQNTVTKTTKAAFEPALDYCVVKIPRWPFDKFSTGDRRLSTQMKATGEVMAIDRSFEAAMMKAVRGLEVGRLDLRHAKMQGRPEYLEPPMGDEALEQQLRQPTDERLWAVAEALRRGWGVAAVRELGRIDPWFLHKFVTLLQAEEDLVMARIEADATTEIPVIANAIKLGYSRQSVEQLLGLHGLPLLPEEDMPMLDALDGNPALAESVLQLTQYFDWSDGGGTRRTRPHMSEYMAHAEYAAARDAVSVAAGQHGLPDGLARRLASLSVSRYRAYLESLPDLLDDAPKMVFKMVDTCAGEFESPTPYFYSSWGIENDAESMLS